MKDPRNKAVDLLGSPNKLLNAATIAALLGHPDTAASILLQYRSQLESHCNLSDALNALAYQTQKYQDGRHSRKLSYKEYMTLFENDDPYFYCGHKHNL